MKVTANERTYRCMEDNMDYDLSPIVRGEKSYQTMGAELFDEIVAIANGNSRRLKHTVFPISPLITFAASYKTFKN